MIVEQLISAPCSAVLVAEELNSDGTASTMLGCVQADWSGVTDSGDPGIDACFGKLSVPEEFSRRGVGKLLVSSAGENKSLHTRSKCVTRTRARAESKIIYSSCISVGVLTRAMGIVT